MRPPADPKNAGEGREPTRDVPAAGRSPILLSPSRGGDPALPAAPPGARSGGVGVDRVGA